MDTFAYKALQYYGHLPVAHSWNRYSSVFTGLFSRLLRLVVIEINSVTRMIRWPPSFQPRLGLGLQQFAYKAVNNIE